MALAARGLQLKTRMLKAPVAAARPLQFDNKLVENYGWLLSKDEGQPFFYCPRAIIQI
jgi:hypothetical protein